MGGISMKAILIPWLLLAGLLFYGCKKDKSPGKQVFLSKLFADGLLQYEYLYSIDKKPVRRNSYSTNTGQSVFSGFRLYEYSADGLLEYITDFSKTNSFINKYSIQYDVNKRPTRMNDLAADNSIQFYYLFDYDAAGKFGAYELYNAATSKKTVSAAYSYNAGGKIAKIIRTTYQFTTPGLYDSTTFNLESFNFPPYWSYFEMLPFVGLPNGDDLFYEMLFNSYYRYYANAPPLEYTITYSNRTYNNAGLPVKVNARYVSDDNTFPPVITNKEFTYEYINN